MLVLWCLINAWYRNISLTPLNNKNREINNFEIYCFKDDTFCFQPVKSSSID